LINLYIRQNNPKPRAKITETIKGTKSPKTFNQNNAKEKPIKPNKIPHQNDSDIFEDLTAKNNGTRANQARNSRLSGGKAMQTRIAETTTNNIRCHFKELTFILFLPPCERSSHPHRPCGRIERKGGGAISGHCNCQYNNNCQKNHF